MTLSISDAQVAKLQATLDYRECMAEGAWLAYEAGECEREEWQRYDRLWLDAVEELMAAQRQRIREMEEWFHAEDSDGGGDTSDAIRQAV